jgi:hypothetical protein
VTISAISYLVSAIEHKFKLGEYSIHVLQPMSGESLHGFLFRIQMVSGGVGFENLIDNFGLWYEFPQILDSMSNNLKSHRLQLLYDVVREHSITTKWYSSFETPFGHYEELKALFNKKQFRAMYAKRKRFRIKYCEQCIAESLVQNGFGFFRTNWLINDVCQYHDTVLSVIKHNTHHRAIKAVLDAMRGNKPEVGHDKVNDLVISKKLMAAFDTTGFELGLLGPTLMPCAQKLLKEQFNIIKRMRPYSDDDSLQGSEIFGRTKQLYLLLKNKYPKYFEPFFSKNLKYFTILKSYGEQTITERFIKSQHKVCYDCDEIRCISNGRIVKFVKDDVLVQQCLKQYHTLIFILEREYGILPHKKSGRKMLNKISLSEKKMLIGKASEEAKRFSTLYIKNFEADRHFETWPFLRAILV